MCCLSPKLFPRKLSTAIPEMKRKRKTTTTIKKKRLSTLQSTLNPSLPYDLLLIIVARVRRLYYPTLSLLSKSFRSLLASPDLYKVRSLLGLTESCLYVCLTIKYTNCWSTLCRKPDQTLTNDTSMKTKSNGFVLARVPIPDSPRAHFAGLVAVGSDIYNIGVSILEKPSSSVSILDCTSHTWREAPSLRVKLSSLSASVLDRKIYVAGLYSDGHSFSMKNTLEALDTKTQSWDPEPIPCSELQQDFSDCRSICIDGKFHVATWQRNVYAYKSKEGRWDTVEPQMHHHLHSDSYCKIDNVLYSASQRALRWYDTEVSMWRNLQGLVGLPKFCSPCSCPSFARVCSCIRLADYGRKLVVFWDEDLPYGGPSVGYQTEIWCAEISLERHKSCEIWGKVEWFDHVLTVPRSSEFVNVLAVTV